MPLRKFAENFINKFSKDGTTTLAASLAFYTALSLAPLVILFVTISSQFSPELQQNFLTQVRSIVGPEAAISIEMVIANAKTRPDLTSLASLFGIATLLLSASLIFGELRGALNRIFGVKPAPGLNPSYFYVLGRFLRERLLHVGLALSFIFILIASLIASSLISALTNHELKALVSTVNIAVSLIFYVGLFTLTFRYLPDRHQAWLRALSGGALTAVLFVLGKELIGIYLGSSAIGSAYGAAGSIIVLLVWVYYSTLITFVGAQVSSLIVRSRRRTAVKNYGKPDYLALQRQE